MADRVGRSLRLTNWWVWVLPAAFLGYFFLFPVLRVLVYSLDAGAFTALARPRFMSSTWFTIWQALVSTALTLLAALPLTWALSRFNFAGKSLIRALVTIPFVLPTVVVGAAFLGLIPRGVGAILAAHVFFNIAVVVRTVGGVWSRIDRKLEDAARVLGASPLRAAWSVTFPLLCPALFSAAAIVFLFCFASFGTVLILGGGRLRTIEVEIYQQAVNFGDLPVAAALAVLQLVFVVIALWVSSRWQRHTSIDFTAETALPKPQGRQGAVVALIVSLSLGLLSLPIWALIRASIGGWSFSAPGQSLDPLRAVGNSLLYSCIATVIATVIGVLAARVIAASRSRTSSLFDTGLMLPLGTSAVTVGFGFLLALDWPVDLRGTSALVPLAHALVATPFVVRAALPLLRSIRPQLREAAAVLGASPARVWREIDFPIVARAVMVGAGLAAVVSLGEFGATSFVVRPSSVTVPTLIFRLLGRPGTASYAQAMALAVVLAAMTAVIVLVIDRLRGEQAGTF
ncbi:MAG: ABC transporter permease [Acidimicrobiia bacterium]